MGSVGRSRARACIPWSRTGATVWSRYCRVGMLFVSLLGFLATAGCCCCCATGFVDWPTAMAPDGGAPGAAVGFACALLLAFGSLPASAGGFVVGAGEMGASVLASMAMCSFCSANLGFHLASLQQSNKFDSIKIYILGLQSCRIHVGNR